MRRRVTSQGLRLGPIAAWIMVALTAALLACATPQPRQFVIFFGTDQSNLTPEAQQLVSEIAAAAREQQPTSIAVAGYGDGTTAADAALADRRAETVIRALAGAGIDSKLIDKRPGLSPEQATGIPVHKATITFNPR
jgi:outer membrane protein OmpA-like peptidoglycan-associated protein